MNAKIEGRRIKAADARERPRQPEAEGIVKREMLRVLVADDSRDMLDTTCDCIGLLGHGAVPAGDGQEALEKFRAGEFDVVVTDFHMPRMSGLELLIEIKKERPDVPVILAFAGDDMEIEAVKAAGAAAVLRKPFGMDELGKELEKTIKK
jgi:CheY-like chemotaxis protein